jgi:uncharacterized membrane protein
MWQIMWMLSLLPDWFWHLFTLAGILAVFAAFVLGKIPFVSTYKIPLKYGGIAAVLFGIWIEGGIANEAKWQAKVAEMEAKVAKAEQESKDANDQLNKKGAQKVKVIHEKAIVVRQYIDREVTKYDDSCKIPAPVVKALNAAAKNEELK